MISKIKTFFKYLKKGQLLFYLHERYMMEAMPLLKGNISWKLHSMLYPNISRGKNFKCWGKIIIRKSPESIISIGDNAYIVSDVARASNALFTCMKLTAFFNSRISIGNCVGLNGVSITCRTTSITIGDGTMIAPNVVIVDSDFHALWPPEQRIDNMGYENDRAVLIGKNVWIGLNSIILKGVTIGDNSIIGSGSVVVNDIPPNVVAAGNPAKVLKKLDVS
ncbi:MAG: transferase [Elusimicrobia bacterium]|nr:transferase [Elusimicrobiota bacterium]